MWEKRDDKTRNVDKNEGRMNEWIEEVHDLFDLLSIDFLSSSQLIPSSFSPFYPSDS